MSDNWVVQNLENTLSTWNEKMAEIWGLLTQSPETFKGGTIWNTILNINGALQATLKTTSILILAKSIHLTKSLEAYSIIPEKNI